MWTQQQREKWIKERPEKGKQYRKEYYLKNKKRIDNRNKKYQKTVKAKQYHKEYYQRSEVKERVVYYKKEYRKNHKKEMKEWQRNYYQRNLEKIKEGMNIYYENNKEKLIWNAKKWQKENPEKYRKRINRWRIKKRKINPKFHLDTNISPAIYFCLKKRKAGRKWQELVGYTLEDLITHLENQFDNKMNWNNYGSYWVIDHIKPRSLFYYKNPEDEEFQNCWALKNLRPLEKIENIKKSNHY